LRDAPNLLTRADLFFLELAVPLELLQKSPECGKSRNWNTDEHYSADVKVMASEEEDRESNYACNRNVAASLIHSEDELES